MSAGRPALGLPPLGLALIVTAIAVAAQVEVWAGSGAVYGESAAALVWTLVLLLLPRFPLIAGLASVAVMALVAAVFPEAFAGGSFPALGALILAFMAIGAHPERRRAVAGGLIALPLALTLAQVPGFIAIVTGGAWLAGLALRTRTDRLAELDAHAAYIEGERESRTRAAVAAERSRIARDAYDLIAESIDEMTIQAETARVLMDDDPDRARAAALAAEERGRRAVDETRRLLGMLRTHDADLELTPQPGLADLRALLARVEAEGLAIEFAVEGEPEDLPPGVGVTAYRVIEEALSEAGDHPRCRRVRVVLRYARGLVELRVARDGPGGAAEVGRHRLTRMRERVALYGGTLDVRSSPSEEHVIRVSLPLGALS